MASNDRSNEWFISYSGREIYPWAMTPDMVCIEDVAHHLAQLCRFAGATRRFYSVGQHAIMTSYLVPPKFAFQALNHDDTEAYCIDMPRPIKRWLPEYQKLEEGIWKVVAQVFDLPLHLDKCVKEADNIALITERRDLIKANPNARPWRVDECGLKPHPKKIIPLRPEIVEEQFLERFYELRETMWESVPVGGALTCVPDDMEGGDD